MGDTAIDTQADRLSPETQRYLDRAVIPLRIASGRANDWPMIASLWFLREGDELWCATPASAKIVSRLRENARCTLEVSGHVPPYTGVRIRALASLHPGRGEAILERLIDRYLGNRECGLARWLLDREVPEMAIRLTPQSESTWDFRARMQDAAPFHS